MKKRVTALVWDFDGTIGDTTERNLRITREIIWRMTGKDGREFPPLRTPEEYDSAHRRVANWREFYRLDLGLTEEQTDVAGRLWTEYQLQDETPTPVYRGIERVLNALRAFPHGIVSQNSRSNIARAVDVAGLSNYFEFIVGYEEVDIRRQKPEPDGLLLCLKELTAFRPGYAIYIGDHEVDVVTALNANQVFAQRELDIDVISIAAAYSSSTDRSDWKATPDYVAKDPADILDVIRRLEPDLTLRESERSGRRPPRDW